MLQEVVRQAPGYQWGVEGKVIDFDSRKLRRARFNFLTLKSTRFSMPPNLSELKLTFLTLELGLLDGVSGGGIAISGFGDAYLRENASQQVSLENVTGREILLRAANQSPTFFSIIVFPQRGTYENAGEARGEQKLVLAKFQRIFYNTVRTKAPASGILPLLGNLGRLLVGVSDPQDGRFVKVPPQNLQSNRQLLFGFAAGNRNPRNAREIRRHRVDISQIHS